MGNSALIRRGRAHVLGDNVSLDDDIIPARFSQQRVTDPAQLTPHLFANIDAQMAARIKPGDIIFAGVGFACGKPRLQGLIAMAALDLSVVCVSMPFKMLRRAVSRAIPVVVGAPPMTGLVAHGDEVEVDFVAGTLSNLTTGWRGAMPPMSPILADIVVAGGAEAAMRDWLAAHPEQALPAPQN